MVHSHRARVRLFMLAAALVLLAPLTFGSSDVEANPFGDPLSAVSVELVQRSETAEPGTAAMLGLLFDVAPTWNLYWRMAGDAGIEPKIYEWSGLPKGVEPGHIHWPVPTYKERDGFGSHIYEGRFILPFTFDIGPDAPEGEYPISVKVDWQQCDPEQCTFGDAIVETVLRIRKGSAKPSTEHADLWQKAMDLQPKGAIEGEASIIVVKGKVTLSLTREDAWADTPVRFMPTEKGVIVLGKPHEITREGGKLTLAMPASRRKPPKTEIVRGLLRFGGKENPEGYWVGFADGAPAPTLAGTRGVGPKEGPEPGDKEFPKLAPDGYTVWGGVTAGGGEGGDNWEALLLALGLAFLGGLILNIMPCVLPVLSIKIMGFVQQSGDDPKSIRNHGLAFGAGVLVSFWVLAGLLLILKAGGESLGWGFQLQEPRVVAFMALLMFGLGLNMSGLFEVGMGLQNAAGAAQNKVGHSGLSGSFMSGVLATVIATPCTAPFMGGALSYAFTQPWHSSLLVFTMLGIGMAAPYVILSMFPKWLDKVPRPGPWMETFKQFMAFPLYATAAWLVWVFTKQVGADGMVALLIAATLIGMGLWAYGRFGTAITPTKKRRIWGQGFAILMIGLGFYGAMLHGVTEEDVEQSASGGIHAQIQGHLDAGRDVFVDFTADWCLSCKANEKAFIDTETVDNVLKQHQIVKMYGDWTKKGPAIAALLKEFDSGSVPTYVYFPADRSRKPIKLGTTAFTAQGFAEFLVHGATGK